MNPEKIGVGAEKIGEFYWFLVRKISRTEHFLNLLDFTLFHDLCKIVFFIFNQQGYEQAKRVKKRKNQFYKINQSKEKSGRQTIGLLPNSYQPSTFTEKLRQYTRHRQGLLDNGADYIRKMQKALRQMNLRLDVAISDVTGQTGRAIIEAIIGGQKDPKMLAELANYRIHKTKEELAKALTGEFKDEFIFELRQSYDIYTFFRTQIAQCDQAIEQCILDQIQTNEKIDGEIRKDYDKKNRKKVNKNAPKMDTEKLAFQLTGGIDLAAIDGLSNMTILSIISEIDLDMAAFKTAKQFAAWLRLAPNNKISGGKTLSSHTPKNKNPLASALQRAAYAIGNNLKHGALHQFYNRIKFKKGDLKATVATARKLAVIIWNMLSKKEQYRPIDTQDYKDKIRQNIINNLNKKMRAFKIRPEEIAFVTNWLLSN